MVKRKTPTSRRAENVVLQPAIVTTLLSIVLLIIPEFCESILVERTNQEQQLSEETYMKFFRLFAFVFLSTLTASVRAQSPPPFNIVKPSTTGVPGEEVRDMKFDAAGNLWIAGRFAFWG